MTLVNVALAAIAIFVMLRTLRFGEILGRARTADSEAERAR